MPKRTICIQNPAKLNCERSALSIKTDSGCAQIPLEDIWVIIIENNQCSLSSYLLGVLADYGIGVIVCGKNHMPCGLQLPLAAHSRHAGIVENQLLISEPLKKQLWKRIVEAKITNQARCLEFLGRNVNDRVVKYSKEVLSGDSSGREAVAAAEYFKQYLTDGTRGNSSYTAPLNYGYAVLRAGIARVAVSAGWLVSRGIHHHSELNAFNLVDDLIEPFRGFVDLYVAELKLNEYFDTHAKAKLAGIFEFKISINKKKHGIQNAIEVELESLKDAVIKKDASLLQLPTLIPLEKIEVDMK